jgi:hypothetical protein
MIIRLRLLIEKVGWKRILLVALGVVVLAAAGAVFAVLRGGGDDEAGKSTGSTAVQTTNLFYLRALAPEVRTSGCAMSIRFIWKPAYHANQYIGATAVIVATGTGIDGTYRKPFKASGVSLDVGPVSIAGGYRVWSASVASIDGDPPGNDTTIQAAPSSNTKCR